jgi:hypothetical protein
VEPALYLLRLRQGAYPVLLLRTNSNTDDGKNSNYDYQGCITPADELFHGRQAGMSEFIETRIVIAV